MQRILVVAPAWVGDAVLAQSLFKRLHERHRGLELCVLAPPWTRPVFERMPEVDGYLDGAFAHGELALRGRYKLARSIAARHFDQAIVLPNSFKSALIPLLAGIPRRTGFVGEARWGLLNDARRLDKKALPLMVERFAQLGEEAGAPVKRPVASPRLEVTDAQRGATLARLELKPQRPLVVLCPGAEYGPAKRWPAAHFSALAQMLNSKGLAVWLVGSPKDEAIGEKIAAEAAGCCVNLCGKTTLSEAIDLLSCASAVVSNDSGLMHVAAALDKPLTALYGSSSPAFTPPLSKRARIVNLELECSPCFERVCPLGHFNCMVQLTADYVLERMNLP